ncbi:MAG TPA: GWxTD domain-containing protein [Gemmatimonadales bacterium]|nr:GWxTD domain-containing protein [Gemmatimonadales bacterium]
MIRRCLVTGFTLIGSLVGCSQWQRVGSTERPQPGTEVAKLFDAAAVYDRMGLFVTPAPLPAVGDAHFLAGPTPDSTLAVFTLSLANHSLTFHRDANQFVAEYHVEVAFRSDSGSTARLASDQTVRVRTFQETLRADESVLFQGFLLVHPGVYTAEMLIRDRNSPASSRRERSDTVPRFGGPALASPIPIYQGAGRGVRGDRPQLLANPRATLPYGVDTLRFYVEGYDLPPGTRVAAEAIDQGGTVQWQDTVTLHDTTALARVVVPIAGSHLPVGQGELRVAVVGGSAKAATTFLVSFSSQWVVTNYAEMLNLLRYFERQDLVSKLKNAPPDQRAEAWRVFWAATDPVPLTPENEALDDYLHRVQIANVRFQEEGRPGWLTDRGEVYITLGEPDEVTDFSGNNVSRSTPQTIRWSYTTLRLGLLFQDLTGFGRFELTPGSRADYQQVLARIRRSQ